MQQKQDCFYCITHEKAFSLKFLQKKSGITKTHWKTGVSGGKNLWF
jgi:hypothetical protein